MKFSRELSYKEILLLWESRLPVLKRALNHPHLPIKLPTEELTLSNDDTNAIAEFLSQQQKTDQILVIPVRFKDHWNSLVILVQKGEIISADFMWSSGEENLIDCMFIIMEHSYSHYNLTEKKEALNRLTNRLDQDYFYHRILKTIAPFQSEINKVEPSTNVKVGVSFFYFNDDKKGSGFFAIENAIEMIKKIYSPTLTFRPKWIEGESLENLLLEYHNGLKKLRSFNREPSTPNTLNNVWQSIEKNIIRYLKPRLIAHYTLYQKTDEFNPSEESHLSHFIESLNFIYDSDRSQSTADISDEALAENIMETKAIVLWLRATLNSLATKGKAAHYIGKDLKPSKIISDELKLRTTGFGFSRERENLIKIYQQENRSFQYHIHLPFLFMECLENLQPTLNQLLETLHNLEMIFIKKKLLSTDLIKHSKLAVIKDLSASNANPYDYLGVDRDATPTEIRTAYKIRARYAHGDKDGSDEYMKRLVLANNTLINPEKRKALDTKLDLMDELNKKDFSIDDFLAPQNNLLSQPYRNWHNALKKDYEKNPLKNDGSLRIHYQLPTRFNILYKTSYRIPSTREIQHRRTRERKKEVDDEFKNNINYWIVYFIAILSGGLYANNETKSGDLAKIFKELLTAIAYIIFIVMPAAYLFPQGNKKTITVTEEYIEIEKVEEIITKDVSAFDIYRLLEKIPATAITNPIELHSNLSPEIAIKLLLDFLDARFYGNNLEKLKDYFKQQLSRYPSETQNNELNLYQAILKIIEAKKPTLAPLQKITDYPHKALHNGDSIFVKLLTHPKFRQLFSEALMQYWTEHYSIYDAIKAFDGRTQNEHKIHDIIDSDKYEQEDIANAKAIYHISQFDFLVQEKIEKYREKAFFCINSISALENILTLPMRINLILQAGVYFQCASASSNNQAEKMADQHLAMDMYSSAITLAERGPIYESLTAYFQVLRYMALFQFTNEKIIKTQKAYQARALYLADIFPIASTPQPLASTLDHTDPTKSDHYLLLATLTRNVNANTSDKLKVISLAYEACLNQRFPYPQHYNDQTGFIENLRQELIKELLRSKNWSINDVNRNIDFPWIMIDRNQNGFLRYENSLALPEHESIHILKSIQGVELDRQSGDVRFIVKPWQPWDAPYKQRMTNLDLSDMLANGITHAQFSLDSPDPNLRYHPFNNMWFSPTSLHGTEFLNTMLLTDYYLKFFTTGVQPQGQAPYAMQSIDDFIHPLPDHLKKIITDFHNAPFTGESQHRFWIEADDFPITDKESDPNNPKVERYFLGKLKMVVKKHRLVRGADGELIDDPSEGEEGWPWYVLNQSDLINNKNKPFELNEDAMIFTTTGDTLYFYQDGKLSEPHDISLYSDDMKRLLSEPITSQDKITKTKKNADFFYRFTRALTEFTQQAHRFTPEYIFAQEFTAHYDEFARYFPEFGRLKALSRFTLIIRILNQERENVILNINNPKPLLNNDQHEAWQTLRGEILSQTLKNMVIQAKNPAHLEIFKYYYEAGLSITIDSSDVTNRCQQIYENKRKNHIKENGPLSRFSKQLPKLEDVIAKEAENVFNALKQERKANFKRTLESKYNTQSLPLWNASLIKRCIDQAMEENFIPLTFAIAVQRNTHTAVNDAIKNETRFRIHPENILLILLNDKKESENIAKQLYAKSNTPFHAACKKNQDHQKKLIEEKLAPYKRYSDALTTLGLGPKDQEKDLSKTCTWVPAAMNRGLSGNRFRFVYGGVAVLPKVRILPTNTPEGQAVANHVRLNPQSTTLSGAQLASQKQAASTMPTSQAATNPQQRARFFQAEEAKRRGKSGTTTADTRGTNAGQRAPAGATAAGGAGGNGGGDGPRGPSNDRFFKGIKPRELFNNRFPEHRCERPNIIENKNLLHINGQFIYVVTHDGKLIVGKKSDLPGGGHIDLAQGKPVGAAGEVRVVNGEIKFIDNASGHYLPKGLNAQKAAEVAFNELGFNIKNKYVEKVWVDNAKLPNGGTWRAK